MGKMRILSIITIICALRMLLYGTPADLANDMFKVSRTTSISYFEIFSFAINFGLQPQYLLKPIAEDISSLNEDVHLQDFWVA